MISAENSIKKILNDITSHKKKQPVEYQINGWLQTYKKKMSGKKILLRKQERKASNLLHSLQEISNVIWSLQKEKKQQVQAFKKKNIRTKMNKRQIFHPQAKKCNENNLKKQSQDNKENIFRENKKNTLEQNGDLKRINLQVSNCQSIKARSRCSSQGYVLKEMRRKLKQKSQLKNYMNNWSFCPYHEGGIKPGTQQQFQFLQKRIRMVVVTSSRSMRPKY